MDFKLSSTVFLVVFVCLYFLLGFFISFRVFFFASLFPYFYILSNLWKQDCTILAVLQVSSLRGAERRKIRTLSHLEIPPCPILRLVRQQERSGRKPEMPALAHWWSLPDGELPAFLSYHIQRALSYCSAILTRVWLFMAVTNNSKFLTEKDEKHSKYI